MNNESESLYIKVAGWLLFLVCSLITFSIITTVSLLCANYIIVPLLDLIFKLNN